MALHALIEKRKEFEAKQKALHDIFVEAGEKVDLTLVKSLPGDNEAKMAEITKKRKELDAIGTEIDKLVELETAQKAAAGYTQAPNLPGNHEGDKPITDIGEAFTKSNAYQSFVKSKQKGVVEEINVEMKTLFQTTAGWAPESIRTGKVVDIATRPIQIIDIIPPGRTNQAAIVYMEETTFTNAAVEVAEGSVKPEATLALTERSSTVRKIAVWIPVTSEQLEDEVQARSYINNRLGFMCRQRLDSQILNGSGIAPNLTGILNTVGIQTFVLAGDRFDAVYTAGKNVRVTGRATPGVTVIHPNDWEQLRLARTDDGLYILGNPNDPNITRLWGLPVVESDAIPEGSVLVGDFANFTQLFEKKGIEIAISDSHDTYFIYNKLAIRAEMRVAFVVYRPEAFCVVTGF